MIYDGPMSDEMAVIHIHPVKYTAAMPLGYFVVPRHNNELVQSGDLCWLTCDQKWGTTRSMRAGERVNQYCCVVRKKPTIKNQVIIE